MYKLLDIINTHTSLYSVYIKMTLNKSFKEFSSGFFLYFFKYLELNLNGYIDLKCWIQDILN